MSTETKVDKIKNYRDYIRGKFAFTTIAGAALGASVGYMRGNNLELYHGAWAAVVPTLVATTYFSGVFIFKELRGRDDIINHASSGSATFSVLAAVLRRSWRAGAIGFVAGGIAGSGYKAVGDVLFESCRRGWISYRVHLHETSQHRTITFTRGAMISYEQAMEDTKRAKDEQKLRRGILNNLPNNSRPSSPKLDSYTSDGKQS